MFESAEPAKGKRSIGRKVLKWAQRIALAIVVVQLIALGGFLSLRALLSYAIGTPSNEELTRITSPDGLVDAVLVERNVHATVGFIYLVYVVPKGEPFPEPDWAIFNAMRAEDLTIEWMEHRHLGISYRKAEIYDFTNIVHPMKYDPDGPQYEVRITERLREKT